MPGKRILVVEDEFLIRLFIAEALGDEGFDVTEAGDGEEAAALIEASEPFDAVLTDYHMPGRLNGMDVARLARERVPETPVVYVTGRADRPADVMPGPRDAFMPKPFGSQDLLGALRRILPPNGAVSGGGHA